MHVDPHIIESLMPDLVGHDRRPSAYLLFVFLWSRTHATGNASASIALTDIAEATGLGKRTVQQAVAWLVYRKLLVVQRDRSTDVGTFTVLTPWVRHRHRTAPSRAPR
jgi:DNA-binding MarR family transcriptional regulator